MSTPGCFSFFKRAKAPAPAPVREVREKAAPIAESLPQPRLPAAHEHFEPCFQCSGSWDKAAVDAELPAYTARAPFSSDVGHTSP
jgi:hypothetical protein